LIRGRQIFRRGPDKFLCLRDLYTTVLLGEPNDEIEQFLFGPIDNVGARAARYLEYIPDDPHFKMDLAPTKHGTPNELFTVFIEYLDAQKLRTPKGLNWLKSNILGPRGRAATQVNLM